MDDNEIKVLIVDDSAIFRSVLSRELCKVSGINIVGTASDPYSARDKIIELKPDVLTLDIEMPRMDGITFLEKLMNHYPLPVIILSSLTGSGCDTAIKAMKLGAIEVMHKPDLNAPGQFNEMIIMLGQKIKAAGRIKGKFLRYKEEKEIKCYAGGDIPPAGVRNKIVAIGASTGGAAAIEVILKALPQNFPGIVISQHMPEHFTRFFANSLNKLCKIEVREAENGDSVQPGLALIARGNYHMLIKGRSGKYYVELKQGPLVFHQRPSVEVLFNSVAQVAGRNAVGIILTGMGSDGANGLLEMKKAGAFTIAQDKGTSVVYGMPMEAVKLNAVDKVLPLEEIPSQLIRFFLGEKVI